VTLNQKIMTSVIKNLRCFRKERIKCSAESFRDSTVETAGHFVPEKINSAELNSRIRKKKLLTELQDPKILLVLEQRKRSELQWKEATTFGNWTS